MMRPNGCPRLVASVASRPLGRSTALCPTRPSGGFVTSASANRLIPSRQTALARRHLSFLPWRRGPAPKDLPVYFPETADTAYRYKNRLQQIRRFFFGALVIYLCASTYVTLVVNPLFDFLEQEYDNLPDEDKEQIEREAAEDEGVLFFLPMPFTTSLVSGQPYKSTDPEWAMFLKVNKDRKLQKEIKTNLAEILRRQISQDPRFIRALGGSDIKVRRMWLDIIYPSGPPPQYHISGIIVADDGIFWGEREMHPAAGSRVRHVLEPKAAMMGLWIFVSTLCSHTARDIAGFMGFKSAPPPDHAWQVAAIRKVMEYDPTGRDAAQARNRSGLSDFNEKAKIEGVPDDSNSQFSAVRHALVAAAKGFALARKPLEQPVMRGCIKVDGILEIQGPKANMALYVRAGYDPSRRQYVVINTVVKHILAHQQSPAA